MRRVRVVGTLWNRIEQASACRCQRFVMLRPLLTKFCLGNSALALTIWLGAGCASVPPPSKDAAAGGLVAEHVRFLSQPALKGRKSGSHGASLARRYLEERFQACGLVPWPQEKKFELPFGLGCNVAGWLPGSDPNLAGEVVLLSAHYDHLGKDSQGRICPGASDNASGVAVLLEAARQLSSTERPRRSVAFVAFDSEEEMLFGSFAFTCRPTVAKANIAAVINLDMLGRNFLDVVTNTLFLVGTESYPDLREAICQAGERAGLRLLPVGSDLIGPRSDHVAFESRGVPSLFLSSGIHRDYHRYTDTAEKLDYAELDRSVVLIVNSVRMLADRPLRPTPERPGGGDLEELGTLRTVLSEALAESERAGIKPQDRAAFAELEQRAEELLASGHYDSKQRVALISSASGTLVPFLLPIDSGQGEARKGEQQNLLNGVQFLQGYYLRDRAELLEAYRQLVAHILKSRPGAFRSLPPFRYEIAGLHDEDILLTNLGNGEYELQALILPMVLSAESRSWLGIIKLPSVTLSGLWYGLEETGTRDQLSDLCLLRLKACQKNPVEAGNYLRLFQIVSGAATNATCKQLIQQQWHQEQCQDETEWVARLMLSGRPQLAMAAMNAARPDKTDRIRQAVCTLITDRSVRGDVRAQAMAFPTRDKAVLLSLCAVLDDSSPAMRREYSPLFDPASPFADQPVVKSMRAMMMETALAVHPYAKKSLGDLARDHLKKAAGRDLGTDPEAWRRWVERQ
jgi:hypothetical protein